MACLRRALHRPVWSTGSALEGVAAPRLTPGKHQREGKPMPYPPATSTKTTLRTRTRTTPSRKHNHKEGSTGDPKQRETKSAATVTEAIDRRTVRQAILTQLLTEVADEIIDSGATLTTHNPNGTIKKKGTLGTRYRTE